MAHAQVADPDLNEPELDQPESPEYGPSVVEQFLKTPPRADSPVVRPKDRVDREIKRMQAEQQIAVEKLGRLSPNPQVPQATGLPNLNFVEHIITQNQTLTILSSQLNERVGELERVVMKQDDALRFQEHELDRFRNAMKELEGEFRQIMSKGRGSDSRPTAGPIKVKPQSYDGTDDLECYQIGRAHV